MAGFGLLRELASRGPAGRWVYGLVPLAKWFLCGFCSMSGAEGGQVVTLRSGE